MQCFCALDGMRDSYGGQIRTLPDLCTWGYRARTRATRSLKQSPCWFYEKSDGRTIPQYKSLCGGRANTTNRRQREEVLDCHCGKNTLNRVFRLTTDMSTTQEQPLSATVFKRS
jgi:hypothetical protein